MIKEYNPLYEAKKFKIKKKTYMDFQGDMEDVISGIKALMDDYWIHGKSFQGVREILKLGKALEQNKVKPTQSDYYKLFPYLEELDKNLLEFRMLNNLIIDLTMDKYKKEKNIYGIGKSSLKTLFEQLQYAIFSGQEEEFQGAPKSNNKPEDEEEPEGSIAGKVLPSIFYNSVYRFHLNIASIAEITSIDERNGKVVFQTSSYIYHGYLRNNAKKEVEKIIHHAINSGEDVRDFPQRRSGLDIDDLRDAVIDALEEKFYDEGFNKPETVFDESDKITSEECEHCEGTGDCPTCGGDGVISSEDTQLSLIGEPEKCYMCHGTGKCPACEGTGNIIISDDWTDEQREEAAIKHVEYMKNKIRSQSTDYFVPDYMDQKLYHELWRDSFDSDKYIEYILEENYMEEWLIPKGVVENIGMHYEWYGDMIFVRVGEV